MDRTRALEGGGYVRARWVCAGLEIWVDWSARDMDDGGAERGVCVRLLLGSWWWLRESLVVASWGWWIGFFC